MLHKESLHIDTNNQWQNTTSKDLCLAGATLALVIVTRLICIILGPFILGYTLQLHYLPYMLGLVAIKNWKYKLLVFVFAPLLITVLTAAANPIFDYILTMYSFVGLMFLPNHKNKLKSQNYLLLIVTVFSFMLVNWWNIVSGVVFYQVTWMYSFAFNTIFNCINFVVIAPLFLICYNIFIKRKININYEFTY